MIVWDSALSSAFKKTASGINAVNDAGSAEYGNLSRFNIPTAPEAICPDSSGPDTANFAPGGGRYVRARSCATLSLIFADNASSGL
ncbi:hypothetical protein BAR24066_03254 [Burkholderia arboris]|uniref:Uncharacterized protein n=1 Tax=Burkholderia arboris TaxID=488730 RepID=A0A9Q9SIU5_9BURK|nr:hypothetical protein BAR24066_03254 [Burkholderia arboris]